MEFNLLNVLIVSGGGFQGLTIIKGLRKSNAIRICIADSTEENVGRYFADSSFTIPKIEQKKEFIDAILSLCERETIKVVVPSTERELHILSRNKRIFAERGVLVAVSDTDLLEKVQDKQKLHQFLTEHDLPALPLIDITSSDPYFPLFGKPIRGWGSKNTIVINNSDELSKLNRELLRNDYIWQPYLEDFIEFSVDFAIGFNLKVSNIIQRKRIRTSGGFSVISECDNDTNVTNIVRDLIDVLLDKGALGIINAQIINFDLQYVITDLNARAGTSSVFTYGVGENLPLFLCSSIITDIYKSSFDTGTANDIKMVRYLDEFWIKKVNRKDIGGIVFDLDDTLINHKAWIIDKLCILWTQYNKYLPAKEPFLLLSLSIIEKGNRGHLFDELGDILGFSTDFRNDLIRSYRKSVPDECPLFPDVIQSLTELRKMEIPLALLTDNPPSSQEQKVKSCHFDGLFDAITYTGELNSEKPDDSVFDEVSRMLQLGKSSLIMIGDHFYKDIIGSLESGFLYAYWIIRDGTFYNFDDSLFHKISYKKYNYSKISNLRQLVCSITDQKR